MKKYYYFNQGFTLVEVMVVVVLLSIFASVGYVNFGSAREQAKFVKAYNDLQQIELALNSNVDAKEISWPQTNEFVPISEVYDCQGNSCLFVDFADYLSERPEEPVPGVSFRYHNRTNTPYSCGDYDSGISIWIGGSASGNDEWLDRFYTYLDGAVDKDDNRNCGKVRKGGASDSIYYLISDV